MTTFLMIARMLYDKGYQQYVDAAKIIKQDFSDVQFLLLGAIDKEYPKYVPLEIIDNDVKSGTIKYLGYNSDVLQFIKEADCIVLPTYYNEGLSRVLMEGLAMSKPIITTDIPGCKETVDDGVNGFLCKPHDTESLLSSLRKFMALTVEERKKMGYYGRKKAIAQFDVSNVIEIYDSITKKYE